MSKLPAGYVIFIYKLSIDNAEIGEICTKNGSGTSACVYARVHLYVKNAPVASLKRVFLQNETRKVILERPSGAKESKRNKMKVLKFAILGCGHIATKMAAAVKTLEKRGMGVECYAVASRTLDKAKKFADDYGFRRAYGSYEELAQDADVDLIYIATPHSEHYNNILLCLKYGRSLLVEKAFTANALMASEVVALAEEKHVGFWLLSDAGKGIFESGREKHFSMLSDDKVNCSAGRFPLTSQKSGEMPANTQRMGPFSMPPQHVVPPSPFLPPALF